MKGHDAIRRVVMVEPKYLGPNGMILTQRQLEVVDLRQIANGNIDGQCSGAFHSSCCLFFQNPYGTTMKTMMKRRS